MKYLYFLLIITNQIIASEEILIVKIGANIIDAKGLIKAMSPKDITLKSGTTYAMLAKQLLSAFKQEKLDGIVTPHSLFLGEKILQSTSLIYKDHKNKFAPLDAGEAPASFPDSMLPLLNGKFYPVAHFSVPETARGSK
mgnify:FL=1